MGMGVVGTKYYNCLCLCCSEVVVNHMVLHLCFTVNSNKWCMPHRKIFPPPPLASMKSIELLEVCPTLSIVSCASKPSGPLSNLILYVNLHGRNSLEDEVTPVHLLSDNEYVICSFFPPLGNVWASCIVEETVSHQPGVGHHGRQDEAILPPWWRGQDRGGDEECCERWVQWR